MTPSALEEDAISLPLTIPLHGHLSESLKGKEGITHSCRVSPSLTNHCTNESLLPVAMTTQNLVVAVKGGVEE